MKRNIILLSFFIIFISGSIIFKNQIESKITGLTDLQKDQTKLTEKINNQNLFKENLKRVLRLFTTNLVENEAKAKKLDIELEFEKNLSGKLTALGIYVDTIKPRSMSDNRGGNVYKQYDLILKNCTFKQFADLINLLEKDERIIIIDDFRFSSSIEKIARNQNIMEHNVTLTISTVSLIKKTIKS